MSKELYLIPKEVAESCLRDSHIYHQEAIAHIESLIEELSIKDISIDYPEEATSQMKELVDMTIKYTIEKVQEFQNQKAQEIIKRLKG